MSDQEKPDWPKTEDGTIDWEPVFEDPATGLISSFSSVSDRLQLDDKIKDVAAQLFSRKNDEEEREKFLLELREAVVSVSGLDDVAGMRAAVIDRLRRLKATRILRAESYVIRQKRDALQENSDARKEMRADERRQKAEDAKNAKKSKLGISSTTGKVASFGGGGIVLIGLIIYLFFPEIFFASEESISTTVGLEVEQEKEKGLGLS